MPVSLVIAIAMKRTAPTTVEEAADGCAKRAMARDAEKEPARQGGSAEGPRLATVNAASPQARRTLCFTLGSTIAAGRVVTDLQYRIDGTPTPTPPATARASVTQLPKYSPPRPGRSAAPCDSERQPTRAVSSVAVSDQAFAAWRRNATPREGAPPGVLEPGDGPVIDLAACAARAVREGMEAWLRVRLMMQDDQRIRFLMESLPHLIEAGWGAAVDLIFREAPLERLQRKIWPGGCRLAHLVLRFGNREYIRRVFSQSALKEALPQADRHGMTPLHLAAEADDGEATSRILEFQDLADALLVTPNAAQWLPIHLAARAGAERAAEHLLLRQASTQRRRTVDDHLCAIHLAAIHARPRLVRLLLRELAHKQLCATDGLGRSALMHAVRWGASAVVKELLALESAQREQLLLRDHDGLSALQHAQASGNREVLALIETALRKAFPEGDSAPLPAGPAPTPQGGEEESAQEPQ